MSYGGKVAIRLILVALLSWICFQILIRWLLGLSISYINPLRLKVGGVKYRDVVHIDSIRFVLFDRRFLIRGVTFLAKNDQPVDDKGGSRTQVPVGVSLWVRKHLGRLIRLVNGLHFACFDINLEDAQVTFGTLGVTIRAIESQNQITLSFLMARLEWKDDMICEDASLTLKCVLVRNKIGGSNPFDNVSLDFKIGDLTIPMDVINQLNINNTDGDEFLPESLNVEDQIKVRTDLLLSRLDQVRGSLHSVAQLTAAIDKLSIERMPLTSHSELIGLNKFLSLNVFAESFTFNAVKYGDHMPGFKLLFKDHDTPFKFNATMSGFSLSMTLSGKCVYGSPHTLKVLEIPNVSFFGSTNLFSQKFDYNKGSTLENAICNLKGQISSPTIDVDVDHLSFFKCFKKNIKVFTGVLSDPLCHQYKQKKSSMLVNKNVILNYLKGLLPLVSLKLTLEDTRLIISDQKDFLVHKLSALMIDYKTSRSNLVNEEGKGKQLNYEVGCNIEIISLKAQHIIRESEYEGPVFSIDNISVRNSVKLVPEPLVSVRINVETFQIDLSELATMIMINNIFKKLDSKVLDVEENYFMDYYKKFAKRLKSTEAECSKIGKCMNIEKVLPSEFCFRELPSSLDYVKIDFRTVTLTLGARSVFMPPSVFSNIEPQSSEDFIDGKLRKYYHKTDKIEVALFGNRTQWHSRVETGRTTMSISSKPHTDGAYHNDVLDDISTSDETEVQHLWNFNVLINDMSSTVVSETSELKDVLSARKVSKVSVVSIKVYPDVSPFGTSDDRKIIFQIENKRVKTVLSLMNIFLVISGVHTLKQIFGLDVCSHKRQSRSKKHFMAVSMSRRKSFLHYVDWSEMKKLIHVNFSSELATQIFVLPNGLTARFQSTATYLTLKNFSDISISGQTFRICVESPLSPNYWARLLTIFRYSIDLNTNDVMEQMNANFEAFDSFSPAVVLQNESWHFSIPHKFELFTLFDNIPTFYKTMKQMIYSFKTSKDDCIIFPHPVKNPSLPKIKLKSQRWIFSIDDDPFESELSMIFQIGLEEQKSRLAKTEEFERRTAAQLLKKNKSKLSKAETLAPFKACELIQRVHAIRKKFKLKRAATNSSFGNKQSIKEDKEAAQEDEKFIPSEIEDAYHRLLENSSTSWIRRVKQYKHKEKEAFEKNFSFLWGNVKYATLPPEFNYRVLPFTTNPFLATLIIEGIDIDLFHPSFGVSGIPDFINKIGKGVPKETKYSIMLPMYLDARFREIRWHLKDYPLPLIYIPSLSKSDDRKGNAIQIHGNLVISEDMIRSDKEIRKIFVPLVPSTTEHDDGYYSLSVPRTITSAKLYTDLRFDIYSTDTTQVTWGGGYQPAIQQTMQCLDNFSKPPIDPSPKLGFWDKMRYMFHARVKISWKNGGKFEVCLKGGKSPHKIGPDSAGFIVGFAGDVVLDCNEKDDPQNFLSCKAEKVHFSIPNHFAKPLLVWSQPSDQKVFVPSHSNTNLQQYASFYYLLDLGKTAKQQFEVAKMSSYYIEKTGINLTGGITLNVGVVLERLIRGSSERTLSFEPHYDARLCNPKMVSDGDEHDSYAGFRSDFLHMSFLLLSKSESAYNTMQLSPAGLHTFMRWWKSFAGNLPVRRGPLFGLQSISPKFGEHLYTISYHADVSPLYITHLTHSIDSSHELKKNNGEVVEFAGLKAKTQRFVMDLHQRKEVTLEYQQGLDQTKKVMNLRFLEGDLSTVGIDIRAVEATFKHATFVEEKSDAKVDIPDNDMAWYDVSDFQEANFVDVEHYIPHVKMLQLLYSSQFMYRKRASYGDKFQVDPATHKPIQPFQNNLSHKCVIGEPLKLPFKELLQRKDTLNDYKADLEQHTSNEQSDAPGLKLKLRKTELAIEKVQNLLDDFEVLKQKQRRKQDVDDPKKSFHYPLIDMIQSSVVAAKEFENRYHVSGMLLKWNEGTRDIVYKYLHLRNLSRKLSSLNEQKSLKLVEDIIRKRGSSDADTRSDEGDFKSGLHFEDKMNNCTDENFTEILREIFDEAISELGCQMNYSVQHNHIVHFISPQIQLVTDQEPDACIVVAAPSIMLKVLSFANSEKQYSSERFLKRYGFYFTKANLFHFHKSDYEDENEDFFEVFFSLNSYAQHKDSQWPPWLSMDLCYEPGTLASNAIIHDFSAVMFYDNVSQFSSVYHLMKDKAKDAITGYIPKVMMASDSSSYLTLFKLITNLIIYMEPDNAELNKQIEKLTIGFDPEDASQIHQMMSTIHKNLAVLSAVEEEYLFKRHILDNADKHDFAAVRNEKADNLLRLYILMRVFSSSEGSVANSDHSLVWDFHLKEIILHMLDNNSEPFLDLAIAKLHFEREETSTGFNRNRISAEIAQAFDLQKNATYKNMLSPYLRKDQKKAQGQAQQQPLITIVWEMNKPIGGIKVIRHAETKLADLSLNLESETIQKVIAWFVPNELDSISFGRHKKDEVGKTSRNGSGSDSSYDPELVEDYMKLSGEKSPDLHEMVQRSVDFVIIENLIINGFKLCISFKGKGAKRIINVTDFIFSFPKLTFENQTLRLIDILIELKKVVLRDILKHTAKFIETKVRNHPDNKSRQGSPLKQLSHYETYTQVDDLLD